MNFRLKNDMIQQSIKVNGVTDDALRLYLFPHSFTHHATAWFDRLPRNSINTFEQMAKMFLGKYFPPSMVTKLRNEITNFCQRLDESLFEAWERGTFMERRPEECYDLIENMTAHHNDWDTSAQRSESSSSIKSSFDSEIVALKAEMAEFNKNLMKVLQINQQVTAVTPSCETYGGPYSYYDCPTTVGQTQNVYAAGAYQGGNSYQPQGNRILLSHRSDNYIRPPGFNQNQNRNNQNQNFQNQNRNLGNNHGIPQGNNQGRNQFFQGASHGPNPPPAYQAPAYQAPGYQAPVHQPLIPQLQVMTIAEFTNYMKANDVILKNMQTNMTSLTNSNLELKNMFGQFIKMNIASSLGSGTLPSNTITNPKEDLKGITTRSGTAYQGPMIPTTSFSLSKVVERETEVTKDTMPPTNNESTKDVQPPVVQVETLVPNSEPVVAPIIEPVTAPVSALKPNQKPLIPYPTPLNEHCSAVLLKKILEKLGDPGKFLIPCDFPGMAECLALADLGASINVMPLFVWNKLSLSQLTPTLMTLELADRSISQPIGVAEDVYVKVGKFHFPADFVVVDFDADPRVPLILRRSFLKTERALIDFFEGELTLRVAKEAITFNLDQTSRYAANYNDMMANRTDVIDMACEEYSQEVLSFSDMIASGNPTPYYNPIVSTSSLTLTPFGDSDFLLEEVDAFLVLEDDATSSEELKIYEAKTDKSSIDEPPEVELKDLPPHLEYAFLEGDDKFPIIIAKDLRVEEKFALIKVLKSHKQDIAWKLSDIKGIDPEFCTHKMLMEDDFKPAVQHQRRVNPKIHDVIKKKEKSHFMVKEGIVLGHKISKNGIEVDKAKVDVIAKLPHPTTVKAVNYLSKWVKAKALPTNDARVVYKFLKSLFARFGTPRAIISDRGMHFCNDQFAKVMLKYGVTHRLATPYHPQTSGQVEVSNRAYKTPIGCTPYKLVYEKACHLLIELEHKAYWALKHEKFDLQTVGAHRKVQLNELYELRDQAYENSVIYNEKTKRLHDSKSKDRVFNVHDRVLLFNSRVKIFSTSLRPAGLDHLLSSKCSLMAPSSYPKPTGQISKLMVTE
nr:hypothetical protein [Tanacetum cinerariifolium]